MVFAPTDAAFAALPADTVETLLKLENKSTLASILTDHVLPGRITSKGIDGKKLDPKTVEGQTLAIDASQGTVKVNDAIVTNNDIAPTTASSTS